MFAAATAFSFGLTRNRFSCHTDSGSFYFYRGEVVRAGSGSADKEKEVVSWLNFRSTKMVKANFAGG